MAGGVWLLATRSTGKLRELVPLLASHGREAITLDAAAVAESDEEDALETFDSFEANALAKARFFAGQMGGVVLADDSGLAADALDGRPGVRSKRWSGRSDLVGRALDDANNAFLQQALAEAARFGREERSARYVCAAACVWPGGERAVRGETSGILLATPRGENGFGYDPYFWSDDLGCTFAEVDQRRKATVSHRGRAFRSLLEEMASDFPLTS
jgi:XTP/dITP diphosphohydrolase